MLIFKEDYQSFSTLFLLTLFLTIFAIAIYYFQVAIFLFDQAYEDFSK